MWGSPENVILGKKQQHIPVVYSSQKSILLERIFVTVDFLNSDFIDSESNYDQVCVAGSSESCTVHDYADGLFPVKRLISGSCSSLRACNCDKVEGTG